MNLDKYIDNYVDIPKMARFCSLCKNYGKIWECPPHSENIEEYWNKFSKIKIIAVKLDYSEEFRSKPYSHEELSYIINNTLYLERSKLKRELIYYEKELNGQYLFAGRCDLCTRCAKIDNEPCRHPELIDFLLKVLVQIFRS